MKVKHIGYGVLLSESGEHITSNEDGVLYSMDTGVLYKVTKRDEHQNIIEVVEL